MLPPIENLSVAAFFIAAILSVIGALWKGGAPERAGAIFIVYLFAFQAAALSIYPPALDQTDFVGLATDALALIAFMAIAMFADRWWPLIAAALQAVSLTFHLARLFSPDALELVYAVFRTMPLAATILLIGFGTLRHCQRVKRYGSDPDWATFASNQGAPK